MRKPKIKPWLHRVEVKPREFKHDGVHTNDQLANMVEININLTIITDAKTASELEINGVVLGKLFEHMNHPNKIKCAQCCLDAMDNQKGTKE